MKREAKVWGERWVIRQDSTHATSYLKMVKGYECSWHKHQEKYNLFVVLSGRISVVTEQFDRNVETVLLPGDCFTTKPGEFHKFVAYENSEVIEEMYVEYSEGDIERADTGGQTE